MPFLSRVWPKILFLLLTKTWISIELIKMSVLRPHYLLSQFIFYIKMLGV